MSIDVSRFPYGFPRCFHMFHGFFEGLPIFVPQFFMVPMAKDWQASRDAAEEAMAIYLEAWDFDWDV